MSDNQKKEVEEEIGNENIKIEIPFDPDQIKS